MDKINRRDFLKFAAGSSLTLAGGAMLSGLGLPSSTGRNAFTFRAVTGLPSGPIPSYASLVIEGGLDLAAGTGILTQTVFAGPPDAMSNIALPGLTRIVRVTSVRSTGSLIEIHGAPADPSQLHALETGTVSILVDRSAGTARAKFLDSEVRLKLS